MKMCIVFLIMLIVNSLACSDLPASSYGLVAIKSPRGEELYFRRVARGLSYEQLILSKDKNHCSEPDPKSDIIFEGEGLPLFYKFEGESLHLYLASPAKVPEKFSNKIEVVQHVINNLEFVALKQNYESKGLVFLDKLYDENLKCN